MTPEQRIMAIGAFVNGALFLIFAFTLGLWAAKPAASAFALLSSGAAFLCYATQAMGTERWISATFMIASLVFAAIAIIALLF